MAKNPPPIGTIENISMGPKLAGEDSVRPHTRFDLEAKVQGKTQGDAVANKEVSLTPVTVQRPRLTLKESVRSYDAPESLSRELSLVKGSLDKIVGRFTSFLKSYNPSMSCSPFEVSALFSALLIFFFKEPVNEETRRFMVKYIDVLLEKVEDKEFADLVLNFGTMLKERSDADSQ